RAHTLERFLVAHMPVIQPMVHTSAVLGAYDPIHNANIFHNDTCIFPYDTCIFPYDTYIYRDRTWFPPIYEQFFPQQPKE
ncbi:hypothetical protein, partial [Aneurinibacillus tyrosinisolvens]|uniref:hypothetical protein n=1 Tax=Aneurinibacillus tyrosinisolvens TaxID=1443435 RepID=UPI00063F3E3B